MVAVKTAVGLTESVNIEKIVKICHESSVWSKVFEEYSTLSTKIDIDSSKNDLVHNKK